MPGPPPHHHPNQRLPPPGMGGDHPPWGGGQHPDFGPPPHGFNGHSPHVRHRQHPVQDDPSLVPNVPYFDLPAGLMAPLVKVSHVLLILMYLTTGMTNLKNSIIKYCQKKQEQCDSLMHTTT